jgi:hypothetical protein
MTHSGQKKISFDYTWFPQTEKLHKAFYTHRTRAAVTGARAGKTTAGIADVRDKAIEQPYYDYVDIDRGEPYTIAIAAPDYPKLERVVLPAWLREFPRSLIKQPYHGTKRTMVVEGIQGDTLIHFLTCKDHEAWAGLKLYGAWIDEFPLISETMYNEVQTRLSDRKGWLLLTGTPRGPNWVKERIYDVHQAGTDPNLFFISWKTIDNPHIDKDEIARLRTTLPPKYFKRQFEASFDVFEGQIYEEFMDDVHAYDPDEYTFMLPSGRRSIGSGPKRVKFRKVVAGVDWGFGVGHPGCILIGGNTLDNKWYIVEESFGEQINVVSMNATVDSWVKRARFLQAKWEVAMFFCDNASPQNIALFRGARLKADGAMKAVKEGIQVVCDYLKINEDDLSTRLQISKKCRETLGEITYYHWREGKEEPEKVNDHTMDALRYLIYTYQMRGTFEREPNYTPR